MENKNSDDFNIYLNHINNAGGSPKEKWEKVQNSVMEPMALLPLVLGIVSLPFTFLADDDFVSILFIAISSVGLSIGINYFLFYYNKQTEYQILKFKAESTVRNVNLAIKSLLRKNNASNEDKTTIDILTSIIDYWQDYYPSSDLSKTEILKQLKDEIREEVKGEKNEEIKHEKLTVFTKVETEARHGANQ